MEPKTTKTVSKSTTITTASASLSLHLFLGLPLYVFFYNTDEMLLPVSTVVGIGAALAIPLFILLAGGAHLLRKTALGKAVVVVLPGLALAAVALIYFFPLDTVPLTGHVAPAALDGTTLLAFAHLGGAIATGLLLARFAPAMAHTLNATFLGLGIPLCIALFLLSPTPPNLQDVHHTKAARAAVLALHPHENIIIVLLDNVQGRAAQRLFEKTPDLAAKFPGFALYPNTVCGAGSTVYGLPVIYSGDFNVLKRDIIPKKLIASLYSDSIFSDAMTGGFSPAGVLYPPLPKGEFPAISLLDLSTYNTAKNNVLFDYLSFMEPCLHRIAPRWALENARSSLLDAYHALQGRRSSAWATTPNRTTAAPSTAGVLPRDMSVMTKSRRALLRWRDNLTASAQRPGMVFVHSLITHSPFVFAADGTILQEEDDMQTLEYGLRVMAGLNARLKKLGVYDTSTIIYLSDHGHGRGAWPLNAMIMVKEAGASGSLDINPTPAWHPDIRDYLRYILHLKRQDAAPPLFAGSQRIPDRELHVTAHAIPVGRLDISAPNRAHWDFVFTGSFEDIPVHTALTD